MIVDGRAIAKDILEKARGNVGGRLPVVRAISVQPSAATESYLRIKGARAEDAGMRLEVVRLPEDATTEDVLRELALPGAQATIVQLPLPAHIDTQAVLDAIPESQDADVLSAAARARFSAGEPGALLPPVVGAVREILMRAQVAVTGAQAVVVGNGWLVGAPVGEWLRQQGARVEVVTRENAHDLALLKDADIVVSGAGVAGLITPDLLKAGGGSHRRGHERVGRRACGRCGPVLRRGRGRIHPGPGRGWGPSRWPASSRMRPGSALSGLLTNRLRSVY